MDAEVSKESLCVCLCVCAGANAVLFFAIIRKRKFDENRFETKHFMNIVVITARSVIQYYLYMKIPFELI